jgi:acetylornithine deacetylase/succinyl-diaminopimelate desuccinylase-like protein
MSGLAVALLLIGALDLSAQTLAAHQQLARDVYKQLIEINTSGQRRRQHRPRRSHGRALSRRRFPGRRHLRRRSRPRKGNLVVRYRGRSTAGLKPILLLAHLDVVEAKKEDWSPDLDPFKFIEKDGYFYGRGTADDKAMAAIFVTNLLRMKQQNLVPERDLVLALTSDEEGGDYNGVEWLIANHRALVDAEFGLNEGRRRTIKGGRRIANRVQATEKVYEDFTLEVTNKGGHSSLPQPSNAIYQLADALARIAKFTFPVKLNEVTRAYFEKMASDRAGPGRGRLQGPSQRRRPTPRRSGDSRRSRFTTPSYGRRAWRRW